MKAFRIKGWEKHYENNRSRELKRPEWLPLPNKFDGTGFMELMDHPAGMSHYGAWCLLLGAASRQPVRGLFVTDSGKAMTIKDIARMSRGSASGFEEALPRLLAIGWVEEVEIGNDVSARESDSNEKTAASGEDSEGKNGADKSQQSAEIPQQGAALVRLNEKGNGKLNENSKGECETRTTTPDHHDLARPPGPTPPTTEADRYRYEVQPSAWFQALKAARVKIGPESWRGWKSLVETHGIEAVVTAAKTVPAESRWDDQTEKALLKAAKPAAEPSKYARRTVTVPA